MLNFSLSSEQKLQKQMSICEIKSSWDSWSTKLSRSWRRHSSKSSFQLIMYEYENANATRTLISSRCQSKTDETNSWTKTDSMHSWNMWKTLISNIIFESQILIESSRVTLSSSLKMKRMKTWTCDFANRHSTFFQSEDLWENHQRIMCQLTFQNLMLSWLTFRLNRLMHWRLSRSTWMHYSRSHHKHQMITKFTWMFRSLRKSLHQACWSQQFKHFCM